VETAIAALIVLTVVLFGVLTIVQGHLSSQDAILESWREMEERTGGRARTQISAIGAGTESQGSTVKVTIKNEGETKLADFDQWDVVVQYYRATGDCLMEWLPYTETIPPEENRWTVVGIYLDASTSTAEIIEPGILNPDEEILIQAKVNPPVGPHTTNLATIATLNGISTSAVFTRLD